MADRLTFEDLDVRIVTPDREACRLRLDARSILGSAGEPERVLLAIETVRDGA